MLKKQTRAVVHMVNSAKSRYCQEKLTTADSKEMFRVVNCILNQNAGTPLLSGISDQTLANDFVHFFYNKVQKISLDKSDFNNNTAFPDLDEPLPEPRSFRVQTREELDKFRT